MSGTTIFGLQPFEPKRQFILPCEGGEITLYVLEGEAYAVTSEVPGSTSPKKEIQAVHFGGWIPGFRNAQLDIPKEYLVSRGRSNEHYVLDVIFRLVPSAKIGQTAEIVAISHDGCKTFHENELSTLVQQYADV